MPGWQPMLEMQTTSLHTPNTATSKFGITVMVTYGRLGIIPRPKQQLQQQIVITVIRLFIRGQVLNFTLTMSYKQL